jgi:hypothetical protein
VSSHFDSVAVGPGADDDSSGTAALLETARMLAPNPLPVTIVFASFTGEEAGLLGSRRFVQLAGDEKWSIVGALNNDMIGWGGEGSRMDNTIRYSNAGIRDIQHGAAFLFSKLVLYDAKYYRGTDAAAFYDGWGDIVGGIGRPVPPTRTITNRPIFSRREHQQVVETAKVTAATLRCIWRRARATEERHGGRPPVSAVADSPTRRQDVYRRVRARRTRPCAADDGGLAASGAPGRPARGDADRREGIERPRAQAGTGRDRLTVEP